MQFRAPVPHLNQSGCDRAASEQCGLRLYALEVAADRDRLRNHGAVIKYQRRHPLHRIDRGVSLRALLQFSEIDLFARNLDALLAEENAYPPRIGRSAEVVKLHCSTLYRIERKSLSRLRRSLKGGRF